MDDVVNSSIKVRTTPAPERTEVTFAGRVAADKEEKNTCFMESIIRLAELSLMPLYPTSLMLLYSPGLRVRAYLRNQTAGSDRVAHAHGHVVRVLPSPQEILVSHEVGAVVNHEAAALHPAGSAPAQIVFFEDKNFQGRSHECSADCPDLRSYFSRCNSIKVESGCWVLYERPNYTGNQYILSPGEYPDYQQWMGFNDSIKSCRCIKNVYGKSWKIRFYEKKDFGGQTAECVEDCPSVYETYKFQEAHSSVVMDGAWVVYDQPNYHGHQYFLERGEYHNYTDWGATSPAVGSFRMITEF